MANNSNDDVVDALISLGIIVLVGGGIALFLKAFGGHKKGERLSIDELPAVDAHPSPASRTIICDICGGDHHSQFCSQQPSCPQEPCQWCGGVDLYHTDWCPNPFPNPNYPYSY